MRFKHFFYCFLLTTFWACAQNEATPISTNVVDSEGCQLSKIKFDIEQLDKRGLIGTENHKTGLNYEFCIPKDSSKLKTIRKFDGGLKLNQGKGRSGCSKEQWLITGNTYNKQYKHILCELTKLAYIKEINQTYWE